MRAFCFSNPCSAVIAVTVLTASAILIVSTGNGAETNRWWKGNLHTHTLWSDGDDYPEMVAAWYKEHDYNFLALSDHNVMLEGERWINARTNKGGNVALEKYIAQFGTHWVMLRMRGELQEVRLKTLAEFRPRFEEAGKFLMIPGEEITDKFNSAPIHINASNLRELIKPQGGKSVADVIQNDINAVMEQRRRTGQAMIPHVNHPNFEWALTAEDMVAVRGERFFEVYNGHPSVHNYGDRNRAGMERLWDILLTRRLAELGLEPLWGTGADDSHGYHKWGVGNNNPGRGWVMVRASELNAEKIVEAMEQGDFYTSSGVLLKDIQRGPKGLRIEIEPETGVTFTTQFIGTRKGYEPKSEPVLDEKGKAMRVTRHYSADIGQVLAEGKGNAAGYSLKGDEIYVRAKVISSKKKENPYAEGEFETAWVQPLVTGVR
jgi:hypothetical protein